MTFLWGLLDGLYLRCYRLCLFLIERRCVPDFLIRCGIRYLLGIRLRMERRGTVSEQQERKQSLINQLKTMPIAINTTEANEQHYELPTKYFDLCLGTWKKYSSCFYKTFRDTLDKAEENMMSLYCTKAGIKNGMRLLDVGCGWGSLTLFMATAYPESLVTAVSNSKTQKEYIEAEAERRGLRNIRVITSDMNFFEAPEKYDRILSIEMFEHMKNYQMLLRRMASWLKPDGRVFIHYFCHKQYVYEFKVQGEDDWMAKYFFTGGTMPSLDLLLYFQEDLVMDNVTYINGTHYSRTLETWLRRMDMKRNEIMSLFKRTYGSEYRKWFVYWRLFYMACSELFRYNGGDEYGLAHLLLVKRAET